MSNDIDFETYLFISPQKIIISVNDIINFKTLYISETLINIDNEELYYEKVDLFLDENIFLIEKTLKKFVRKISLIIESKNFFSLFISIKNKNYSESISQKTMDYLLNEAKSLSQETIKRKKIIHMIIDNYIIDNKNYQSLELGEKCNSFSLDIRFICLSEDTIQNFEIILRKYQVSLGQIVNAEYVRNFFENDDIDIFNKTNKIINGCNENEVKIVSKTYGKKGIFERFFNLFS